MPNYSNPEWTKDRLLSERQSTVIRLVRERKELLDIDRALAALKAGSNGGVGKREEVPAGTEALT